MPQQDGSPPAKCGECISQQPAFDATIVASDYAPPIDQMVLALKFGGRLALAPLFARLLSEAIERRDEALPTWLAAVPLGADRLAQRGFNQALEIARPLAHKIGANLHPRLVERVRETAPQTLLHPDDRRKNIRNAFTVSSKAIDDVQGKHIGLVDDVLTTGETLNELAATLKRFGALRVTNFVFARTLK